MRSLVLALATTSACAAGTIPTGPDAGTEPLDDAPAADAADASCHIYIPPGGGTDRGKVGGTGGSKTPLACDDAFDERIVGIALEMSNQNTAFGGRSARGITIECAPVTVDPSGSAQLGAPTTTEIRGTGAFGWSPATATPMTRCPTGSVLTGLLAHRGSAGNRFLNVTMTCSDLDASGRLGATHSVKITGSLSDTASPSQATCGPGEVVSGLGAWTGAGLDAVSLFCAAPTCR